MESVPLIGQLSLLGLSLGLNVTGIILLLRGILATRPQLESVQKMSDTWQHAWEVEKQTNEKQAETLNKLVVIGETSLRILEALPPQMHAPGEYRRGQDDVLE